MSPISKTLLTLASLASLSLAAPTSFLNNLSTRQHPTDCPSGQWYSSCYDIKGCFAYDPCVSPPPPTGTTPSPATTTEIFENKHYNIYPTSLINEEDLVPHVDLKWLLSTKTEVTQSIIVFPSVPANAKTCTLMWRQGAPKNRDLFFQDVSGQVKVTQVSSAGFPAGGKTDPITHLTTEDLVKQGKFKGVAMDFTNWEDLPAQSHISAGLDCQEKIVVHLGLQEPTASEWANAGSEDPRVFLATNVDAESGLYLSVTV